MPDSEGENGLSPSTTVRGDVSRSNRLELHWVGKGELLRPEPRVLLPIPEKSCQASIRPPRNLWGHNLAVHGDNLLALKALQNSHANSIQCVYIDPPYNTGSAFTHYDDGLEHSLWLSLMQPRLELLRDLMKPSGVIFISIDDEEMAYLKVLCDEVFGRANFLGTLVWEKKKKPSFLSHMGGVTEFVLAYAKNRFEAPHLVGGRTTVGKKYPLNNAGNGIRVLTFPAQSVRFGIPDGRVRAQDMSGGNIVTKLLDDVIIENGRNKNPFRLEGEWRYAQAKLDELIKAGEDLSISKVPFRPNHHKAGDDPKKLKNLLSIAHYGMSTYEDATAESEALFGKNAFDYPKPEKLIATLILAVTEPDDYVLDSFAGSGTTAAVAHKLGRRWITIEQGDHFHSHVLTRLEKVVQGADPNGVTESADWQGGGNYWALELAPSLLERDEYGNWIISPNYNAEMLAEALCKFEGYKYEPSTSVYWEHGKSNENSYIYVTTQTLTADQLHHLNEEVGPKRSLLICCAAYAAKSMEAFPRLTIKKIPKAVLHRCEWGRDDYSLAIKELARSEPTKEAVASIPKPAAEKKRQRKTSVSLLNFGDE